METAKFNPNEENMKKRENIKPFGNIPIYSKSEFKSIQFKLCNDTSEIQIPLEVKEPTKPAASIYVAPSSSNTQFSYSYEYTTVRITNIPRNITREVLLDILIKECGDLVENNVNLIKDRETSISKGIAYMNFFEADKAKEFSRKAMNIVVENCKFAVEILSSKI